MFTGLVQTVGRVASVEPTEAGVRLVVDAGGWAPDGGRPVVAGDSIAISGVCLTVAEEPAAHDGRLVFDAVSETLRRTTLGGLAVGDPVHLEPALAAGQPMGGHVVQGHVDATGQVLAVQDRAADWRLTVATPEPLRPWVIPKGSITIDGVSLTVADREPDRFTVALIPTTLDRTALGRLVAGDQVNLEADMLVKAVVQRLDEVLPRPADKGKPVTMELLTRAGFCER
jgi:riboflavin synthase alpha subunit